MITLHLYSRSGCHLCEEMETALSPYIATAQVEVHRKWIDNDPELQRQFAERIPVLMCEDEVICEYFFDAAALQQALRDGHNADS